MTNATIGSLADIIRVHGAGRSSHPCLIEGDVSYTWGEMYERAQRVANGLKAAGVGPHDRVVFLEKNSIEHFELAFGAALLNAVSVDVNWRLAAPEVEYIVNDAEAKVLVVGQEFVSIMEAIADKLTTVTTILVIGGHPKYADWNEWLLSQKIGDPGAQQSLEDVSFQLYSSGTTGTPKGIIHSHGMRWHQMAGGFKSIYSHDTRSLVSTPLYSNTTLAVFLPTICHGGFARIMEKFDALAYLGHAQTDKTTHTMLVPVQYQRLLAHADFGNYDLSSFIVKFCTSAPFAAELKAGVLKRWPGGLVEIYGMTEGGVVCMLQAHHHPHKLHTVGQPVTGHELIVLDEDDNRLPAGSKGVLTGRSPTMMSGYKNQPEKTREMEWRDADGNVWLKTGDIGIVDEDGFVSIVGRAKDMIISGGFNIYPKDLEELLEQQPEVAEAAVVGMPSEAWGETPVGFVRLRDDAALPEDILLRVNNQLGKTQRISVLYPIDEMPRSHIGKLLKTDLRALAAEKRIGR